MWRKKIKGIISLLGLVPNNSKSGIYGASNKKLDLFKKNNIPILEKGLITGIGAQFLMLSKKLITKFLVGILEIIIIFKSEENF